MNSLGNTLFALLVALVSAGPTGAAATDFASSVPIVGHSPTAEPVDQIKLRAARTVAGLLKDRQFVAVLQRHVSSDDHRAHLATVMNDYAIVSARAQEAAVSMDAMERQVRERKGLSDGGQDLMQVQLYVPRGFVGRVNWSELLVATPPAGRRKAWTTVQAFDRDGNVHLLDARTPPSMPVLIAGIDHRAAARAGVAVMNQQLQAAGLQKPALTTASTGYVDTTKLDRISLKDDEEPWIAGAAEIYAVVSGVQPDQAQAALTVVDMPYLDYDGITYSPNQIMIFWNAYRYGAANIQLFEHDDNTNYKDLALVLTQGVTAILGAFAPSFAVIGQVATAILQAMPSSWFTNDDDYVDTYYTLEKGQSYVNYGGAARNATVTLSPYRLLEQ
jgi:hypothetical protein